MPEPRSSPRTTAPPQADGFAINGPPRVQVADVLVGVTRLAIKARTAPMSWDFQVLFTPAEMELFEGWYREVIETADGEFYAHWIGGGRIVALANSYTLTPVGSGWLLGATALRTRIDHTICDDAISEVFTAIYRADLSAEDIYTADLSAEDIYIGDWDLQLIADNEC